jgi:hypothetical protein
MTMKYDIIDQIATIVREKQSARDEPTQPAQTANRLSCINPFYGEWVDIGVEYFFSVFELDDRDFASQIPALAHLGKSARQRFIKRMRKHLQACSCCALKHRIEINLNADIEQACRENSDFLLQQLRAAKSDPLEAVMNN